MTLPFERTPRGAEQHHLHLFARAFDGAPPQRPAAETDETGALVFSMLTLEAEERS